MLTKGTRMGQQHPNEAVADRRAPKRQSLPPNPRANPLLVVKAAPRRKRKLVSTPAMRITKKTTPGTMKTTKSLHTRWGPSKESSGHSID